MTNSCKFISLTRWPLCLLVTRKMWNCFIYLFFSYRNINTSEYSSDLLHQPGNNSRLTSKLSFFYFACHIISYSLSYIFWEIFYRLFGIRREIIIILDYDMLNYYVISIFFFTFLLKCFLFLICFTCFYFLTFYFFNESIFTIEIW